MVYNTITEILDFIRCLEFYVARKQNISVRWTTGPLIEASCL
jgi:hypothetical protein